MKKYLKYLLVAILSFALMGSGLFLLCNKDIYAGNSQTELTSDIDDKLDDIKLEEREKAFGGLKTVAEKYAAEQQAVIAASSGYSSGGSYSSSGGSSSYSGGGYSGGGGSYDVDIGDLVIVDGGNYCGNCHAWFYGTTCPTCGLQLIEYNT